MELRVASKGNRCGFVAAGVGERRLSLTILPEFWRPIGSAGGASYGIHEPGDYVVHELDRVHLADGLVPLGERLVEVSSQRSGQVGPKYFLVERGTGRSGAANRHALPARLGDDPGLLDSLLGLVMRTGKQRTQPVSGFDHLHHATGDDVLGNDAVDAQTRLRELLRAWELVRELERRVRELRRGYVPAEDQLAAIRGKLLDSGIIRHAVCGDPRLDCEFDEFSEQVPLFRIVVTTLEVLGHRGPLGWGPWSSWKLCSEVSEQAVAIRHVLGNIPAYSTAQAILIGRRLGLPRALSGWRSILRKCLAVLEERPPGRSSSAASDDTAVALWISSPRLWEWILEQSLHSVGIDAVSPKAVKKPVICKPWIRTDGPNVRPRHPDLTWTDHQQDAIYVVDAKYKWSSRPTANDLNQMYMYSHATRNRLRHAARVAVCALVYPRAPGSQRLDERAYLRPGGRRVTLFAMAPKFPRPDQVTDDAQWNGFLRATGKHIQSRLLSPAADALLARTERTT